MHDKSACIDTFKVIKSVNYIRSFRNYVILTHENDFNFVEHF